MRIEKKNSIALLIDFQERLFPVMSRQIALLETTKKLLNGLNTLSVPVLVTQQYTRGLGETLPELSARIEPFRPIEKVSFSCYDEPAFVEELENIPASTVLLFGIEAHVCVLQTAIDLKQAGYQPVVVSDCVSSRSRSDWKAALRRMEAEGILLTTMESILFEMTRSAKAPEFKSISSIVK